MIKNENVYFRYVAEYYDIMVSRISLELSCLYLVQEASPVRVSMCRPSVLCTPGVSVISYSIQEDAQLLACNEHSVFE